MRILRPCLEHGCPNLTERGYCPEHQPIQAEQDRQHDRTYNEHRPEHHAFYKTDAWKRVRLRQLAEQPLCEDCLDKGRIEPATEVHHMIKVGDDPSKKLDRRYLRSLSKSCHSKRTARGE